MSKVNGSQREELGVTRSTLYRHVAPPGETVLGLRQGAAANPDPNHKHSDGGEKLVTTAKIDRNGTSQSVRLPDGFQFDVDEVEILRRGDEVILRKKRADLREAFDLLSSMPEDFFADGRQDPLPEKREEL